MTAQTHPSEDFQSQASEEAFLLDWVGAWYAAPIPLRPAHLTGRTLVQTVHLHAGGQQIRLCLSNRYGDRPLVLTRVMVGRSLAGLRHEEPEIVLFDGQETVTIEAGTDQVSDSLNLEVQAFRNLTISFVVAQDDIQTGHLIASQTSYVSTLDAGPASAILESPDLRSTYPLQTTSWWVLTGVEVLPAQPVQVIVTLGDSTTDGHGSTIDANRRYPDVLAHRLAATPTRQRSVLNAGICWNELLSNRFPLAGEAIMQRVAWDVWEQATVTDLIVQIGINDLRHDVPAAALIGGFQQLATAARERHLRVFGSTILPGSYTASQAAQWRVVNTWLREQGTQDFDAVFDFAEALRHPEDEAQLDPRFDSGDHIHPNDAGYQVMAETVDLAQLLDTPRGRREWA